MNATVEKLWNKPFVTLIILNFCLFFSLQMMLSSLPGHVQDSYVANDMAISLVTSLFAISAIVARLYAGQASKGGKKNFLMFSGFMIAMIGTLGLFWSGTILYLLFLRIIFGFGFGLGSTVLPTMATSYIPSKRMGEGMGYFGLSMSLSMSLGPLFGLFLMNQYGFNVLVLTAFLVLMIGLLLMIAIKDFTYRENETTVQKQETNVEQFFMKRLFLPAFLNFLLCTTYGGIISFLVLFGKEVNIENVGYFFLVNATTTLLVRPFAGKIYDRKGARRLLLLGGIFIIIALMILSATDSMIELMLSGLVFGLGYGMIQPSLQTWMIQRVDSEQRGVANGMFLNSIDLGVIVGASSLGIIATKSSYAMMYLYSTIFMVIFLLLTVFFAPKRKLVKNFEQQ